MRKFCLTVLMSLSLFAAFQSCQNADVSNDMSRFSFTSDTIELPVNIQSAVFHNNKILYLEEGGRLKAFDTLWQHEDELNELLARHSFLGMTVCFDTLFLLNKQSLWWMDDAFALHSYQPDSTQFKYGLPLYTDPAFEVYGCSAGEWGGAVFFLNKKSGITHMHRATSPQQVLKIKGKYIVSGYLAHLSGYSDFLQIADPDQLYVYPIKAPALHCNWHRNDSLTRLIRMQQINPGIVKTYAVDFSSATLSNFIYDTLLYSIYTTETGTYLAQHLNDSLINTDTLFRTEIPANNVATLAKSGVNVAAFSSWTGWTGNNGELQSKRNTGIIFVNGTRIKFLFSK